MKTEREKLELAAKAAGYWSTEFNCVANVPHTGWNPKDSNHDAFSLQCQLRLLIEHRKNWSELIICVYNEFGMILNVVSFTKESEREAKTREAIFEAAALIGEQIKD